ncbi:MAG: DASS family sodium-coupled anion symporter [bacterium]
MRKAFRPGLLFFAAASFFVIINLPTPDGLSPEGLKALAIFFVCIFLWITHALPLMITSLLAVILFPLTGVLSAATSYSLFGNQAIFFILGAFILASGMMRAGLSTRLALLALRHFGKSPRFLLSGFLGLSAFLSFWMSAHAVAAMMFPIVLEVVDALRLTPLQSRYGKGLFLAMTWGCIVGGITTFLGGARAPLALGILQQSSGFSIDFMHWSLAALPTVVLLIVIAYFVLIKLFSPEVSDIRVAQRVLSRKAQKMGRVTRREQLIGGLMVLTIICWIAWGNVIGLATIAIASVVVAFILKLLDWKEVEEDVNWGVFLMYGGAICLGFAMEMTGAAHWLAERTIGTFIQSPWAFVMVMSLLSLLLTEAISNTAVVAFMMPLALAIAADFSVDPRVVALAITIPTGLAFQLPMGTPATALAISSGYVGLRDTIIGGAIMNLVAWVVFLLIAYFYWPLIGFKI